MRHYAISLKRNSFCHIIQAVQQWSISGAILPAVRIESCSEAARKCSSTETWGHSRTPTCAKLRCALICLENDRRQTVQTKNTSPQQKMMWWSMYWKNTICKPCWTRIFGPCMVFTTMFCPCVFRTPKTTAKRCFQKEPTGLIGHFYPNVEVKIGFICKTFRKILEICYKW